MRASPALVAALGLALVVGPLAATAAASLPDTNPRFGANEPLAQAPIGRDAFLSAPSAATVPADGSTTVPVRVGTSLPHATGVRVALTVSPAGVAEFGADSFAVVANPSGGDGDGAPLACRLAGGERGVARCTGTVPAGGAVLDVPLRWKDEGAAKLSGMVMMKGDVNLFNNKFSTAVTAEEKKLPPPPSTPELPGSDPAPGGDAGTPPLEPPQGGDEDEEDADGEAEAPPEPELPPAEPDVVVGLTGPESSMVGKQVAYTLTAANGGEGAAGPFEVSVTLDGPGALVGATPAAGACAVAGTVASCRLDGLGPGNRTTVTLLALGTEAAGVLTLTPATSEGSAEGPVSTELTEPETDLVFAELDVSDRNPKVGDRVTVRIGVKNDGDVLVRDAYVETGVPGGLDLGDQRRGPCVTLDGGAKIRCYVGTIRAGATKTLKVDVTAELAGTFSASGVAGSGVKDLDPGNNGRSLTVTVDPA